jgi:hypothetical protein
MPALNFKAQFADKVEFGEKKQTIRPARKNPIRKGDTLKLYTGQRTKNCRLLRTARCINLFRIKISDRGAIIINEFNIPWSWSPNIKQLENLAENDGFETWPEMQEFFRAQYGLPFEGVLIRWET